jgi:hypothetical protein
MPTFFRTISLVLCLISAVASFGRQASAVAGELTEEMIELVIDGQKIEGTPIAWDEKKVHLLARDGRLWEFPIAKVTDYKKTADHFRGYSPSEFRAALLRELGVDYEVSGTSHYLVAHPRGQGDKWAERFEDLYRSFVHYFSVRGFEPSRPPYPLIGIVCKNQADFAKYAVMHGAVAPTGGVVGYYDVISNRISIYDMGGKVDSASWRQNAGVLIHEATHQTAFNTGVHCRWSPPPKWLAEGLALVFEAPGVYDSQKNGLVADRVNQDRLKDFRQVVLPHHRPALLSNIVASDEMFNAHPGAAYAESWAMSFFLLETEPRKYVEYLKRTASLEPFDDYSSKERLGDFTAVFGADWPMFDAKFMRFIGGLK